MTTQGFMDAVKQRRSIYGIGKERIVGDDEVLAIIGDAVKHTPSPFNSQSARVVVLLGAQHDRLWDLTEEALRKVVPPEKFAPTEEKIASFRSGYGSVLYFEDMATVEGLQRRFPAYKDNFPVWSHHSSGMLQLVVWTALEAAGLGASLQHYNPLIDDAVKKEWELPESWRLIAEMPFGKPTLPPGDKTFLPLESRLLVFR